MRVLLEKECGAVAGGHESQCEQNFTAAAITMGAGIGAIAGSGAGGIGAIPGAIAGGSAGALVGEVAGPPLCRWEERQKEKEEEALRKERDALFEQQYVNWSQGTGTDDFEVTGPHQLVVDTNSYST